MLGLGAALAVDLVDVHRERLAGAEDVPGARGAGEVEREEVRRTGLDMPEVNSRAAASPNTRPAESTTPVTIAGMAAGMST